MENTKETKKEKEKENPFDIDIEITKGIYEMNITVYVENKKMLVSELMEKCIENNQINNREDSKFNLKKCVCFEFRYEGRKLLPYKSIDFYDIKHNSKLQLIIDEDEDEEENDYCYSDLERDEYQQIYFTTQKEYQNKNMKIKEGLNILCQCKNHHCITNSNKICKKNTHIFREKSNSYFDVNFYSPKQEKRNSPIQSPLREKTHNKGMFIYNLKSVKFNFILDKKKLKCPECEHTSEFIGCILYNKGCIFKGVKVKKNENFSKEIEIPEFSNKLYCAKYIDLLNDIDKQEDIKWSKLTVDIKEIDNNVNYQNYLINVYPVFQKEIALLFSDFPISKYNTYESWYKTQNDKDVFLIGKSKHKERGIFKFNDKNIKFIGYLKDGEMNSNGFLIDNQNITLYKGSFKNGMKHGKGLLWLSEHEYYKGEFKRDNFHGKGIIYYANGNTWEGTFQNGLRNGIGVFTKGKDGKKILCFYRNDKLEWNFTEVIEKKMKWDGTKYFGKEFQENDAAY